MKLYIISDGSLPIGDQAAQSAHAVAQWTKENGFSKWDNQTIVLATTDSMEKLILLTKKLDSRCMSYSKFNEPDLNNQLTSIACLTDSNIFDKYKLLGATL